jgi:type IV pilus assembly protein PilM
VSALPVINGLLIAAVKDAVQANVKSVTRAGLSPVEVDLIPFALTRAMLPRASGQGTVVLISIGANSTNVVIAQNGVPRFVRIIPSGGDDITTALATELDLSVSQAEVAKRELGFGSMTTRAEHRPIVELIFKVAGEQLNALRNTIGYYANANEGAIPNRIILSGGGSYLPGLPKALEELTGIPVTRAQPPQVAGKTRSTGNDFDRYTTAHALALVSA